MKLKIFDLKVRFLFSPPIGSPFFANVKKMVQMNQYTYNVPSGSSGSAFTQRGPKGRVYGWDGWDGMGQNIKSVLQISLYFVGM